MRKARVVLRVLVAFFLAIPFPLAFAAFERSPVDEGEDATTLQKEPVKAEVEVPRTEEAMNLAQQVIGKLRESYYFLKGAGMGAFEANFTVKEGPLTLGTLKASWDAKKGSVSTEFSGKPGYPNGDWLEQLSWAALSEALSRSFVPRGLYAAQTDDGYVIADYSVDPAEVKSVRSLVSNDLLLIRKIIRLPDDQEKETVWQAQEAQGRKYLASMTIIARIPDQPERKVTFALTYTARYGPAFVRKLAIEDTGFGAKGSWILELDKVAFTKAEPSGGEVPQTQEAKDLAREILTKLNESHYSLLQTNLDGFQAVFTLQKDGKPAGELTMGWNRNDGQIATGINAEGIEEFQDWLRGAMEWCLRMTVLSWTSPQEAYAIYATKKGNTYLLDASEDPSVESKTMLVSEDFRRLRDVLRYDDGFELDSEYAVETAEGQHFVKSMKRIARQPEAEEIRNEFALTYVRREGVPFIKRVVLENIEPAGKTSWTLELKDVALHRAAAPEPEVTEPTTPTEKEPEVSGPPTKEAVVIPEPPAGYVKGEWANARVGTSLRIQTLRPDVFGNVPVTLIMNVTKADEKTVTVRTMAMEEGKVVREAEGVQPRFMPKEQLEKGIKDLGDKERDTTIEISGKEYKCEVYRQDARLDDGTRVERQSYVCWEIPGWVVRRISSKAGTLYEVVDYTP